MSPISELSANQLQVLTLIATGSTTVAAAKEAGVHRNTVTNWLRTSEFRQAMTQARHEKALCWREIAGSFADEALRVIVDMMVDSKTPASVRLRAALAILDKAIAPLPPEPEIPEIVHKNAQSDAQLESHETKPMPGPMPIPEIVHKNAQPEPRETDPTTAATHKTGIAQSGITSHPA